MKWTTVVAAILSLTSIAHAGPLADDYKQRQLLNDQSSYRRVIAELRTDAEKAAGSKSVAQEIGGADGFNQSLYVKMANGKTCLVLFRMVNESQASSNAPDCE